MVVIDRRNLVVSIRWKGVEKREGPPVQPPPAPVAKLMGRLGMGGASLALGFLRNSQPTTAHNS
jgi:hypothetical protein